MRRLLLAVLVVAACDSAIRPTSLELSFLVVSGDGQSGTVGSTLPQPLVIKATDSKGRALRNLTIEFRVTSGGGSASPVTATTNNQGLAQTTWTLGTSTAVAQGLEARSVSTGQVFGAFTATALPGPAATLVKVAGDSQTATRLTPVAIRPAVRVLDQYGNAVPGVSIPFSVVTGGGTITGSPATSGADGVASAQWTLGSAVGAQHMSAVLQATAIVSFVATATLGTGGRMAVYHGNNQLTEVNVRFPLGPAVRITDASGNPIEGVVPTYTAIQGGGSLAGGSDASRADGVYDYTNWIPCCTRGTYILRVTAEGIPDTVFFTGIAEAGPAKTIAVQAGNGQSAFANATLAIAPAAVVRDTFDNPVPGVAVAFAVTAGGGSVSGTSATTDTNGIATVGSWTLGPEPGPNTLSATAEATSISGNPVTFTAQAIGDVWTAAAPLSGGRGYVGVATLDGKVYAVSGLTAGRKLEAYDPATNTWTPRANMPTSRTAGGVGAVNGMLYVAGGWVGGLTDAFEAYDPVTDTWTAKAPLPTPRYMLTVTVVDGTLYAIGGYTGTLVCETSCGWVLHMTPTVEAYDPVTDSWTTKASMPTARVALASAELNGVIYAIGGKAADNNSWLTTVEAYDPATDSWTAKPSMPTGRFALGAGAVGGQLYAIGGEVAPNTIIRTVEVYDPQTNIWATRAPLPTNRKWFGTATLQGLMYVVGGQSYIVTGPDSCVCQVPDVNVYHHP